MEAAIKAARVKALRLLFVFEASVPERVAKTVLTTESAAVPAVKFIGSLGIFIQVAKHAGKFSHIQCHFCHEVN